MVGMSMNTALDLPLTSVPSSTSLTRRRSWVGDHPRTVSLVTYCGLSFLLFASTWVSPFTHVIGVPDGDQTGFYWGMVWPLFALSHGQNALFTNYLHYPSGVNLVPIYPPLPAFLVAPVTALAGPVLAYNLLTTLTLATSAWLMAIATHRFVPSWRAAFCSGLLFGFGPFAMGQALDHVSVLLQFGAPLLLLLLHEALVRQKWRPWLVGLAIGAVVTAQLFSWVETVAILALFVVVGLAVAWFVRDRTAWAAHRRRAWQALFFAALASIVLGAYPLAFMLLGPQHLPGAATRPYGLEASNLANLVVPSPIQLLAPTHDLSFRLTPTAEPNPTEWNAYLGIPLLLVCGIVVVRCWADRIVRWASVMAACAVVLSCGPVLILALGVNTPVHLPAELIAGLPWFNNIIWSRLAIEVELFAALLLAVYVAAAANGRPLIPRRLHWLLVAAVVATLLPQLPYPTAAAPAVPSFFTTAAVDRIPIGSVALVAPFTTSGGDDAPEYWQAASGFRFRMIAAYTIVPGPHGAAFPPLTPLSRAMRDIQGGLGAPALTTADRRALKAEITRDAVRTVIVGPMPNEDAMVSFMTDLLGRAPVQDHGTYVWWDIQ